MARDDIDRVQAVAITLFASALIERCQDMIARLTDPTSVVAEIGAFRTMALAHAKAAGITIPVADEEKVRWVARQHVEDVCAAWLGEEPEAKSEAASG